MNTQPAINSDFSTILATENDQPGPPFFDATMNFLNRQYVRADMDIDKMSQQKEKLNEKIADKTIERDTARELLVNEWRERRPANPQTGEVVMAPFGEE